MMRSLSRQYVAGFFDGEGSVGVYARKDRAEGFHLRTQLVQNNSKDVRMMFGWLIFRFGGHCTGIDDPKRKKFSWQLNSNNAVTFLRWILPYLVLKKDQAKVAIDWQVARPKRFRDRFGRIRSKSKSRLQLDLKVVEILKAMKRVTA